jgi:hypothetical protein
VVIREEMENNVLSIIDKVKKLYINTKRNFNDINDWVNNLKFFSENKEEIKLLNESFKALYSSRLNKGEKINNNRLLAIIYNVLDIKANFISNKSTSIFTELKEIFDNIKIDLIIPNKNNPDIFNKSTKLDEKTILNNINLKYFEMTKDVIMLFNLFRENQIKNIILLNNLDKIEA